MVSATGVDGSISRSHMSSIDFTRRFVGPLGNTVSDGVFGLNGEDTEENSLPMDSTNVELEPIG